MSDLYCKSITSLRRNLPPGSRLLLGDQILNGSAIKTSLSADDIISGQSAEEDEKDQIAEAAFGIGAGLNEDLFRIGEQLGPGDFVTEGGFEAGPNGIEVVHSGIGGEARVYAPGTSLDEGDLILNGTVTGPDGTTIEAPTTITGEGYVASGDGVVVSPGGADTDEMQDAYCSLQELAGTPEKGSRLEDALNELELDLEIPGLDFAWWVAIQKKLNQMMAIQGKFIAKTQSFVNLIELDPEDACKYVPDVNKLIKVIQRVLRTINTIRRILDKINKLIKKLKKVIKLLKWLFAPIRIVEAFLLAMQIIEGFAIMLDTAVRNLTDTSKVLPRLIALLQKILAQCASNRGAEAGLTKEECEAAGGVYVDRRPGDLGAAPVGGAADAFAGLTNEFDGLDDLITQAGEGFDDGREGFMGEGAELFAGDVIEQGQVLDPNGNVVDPIEYPFIVPYPGGYRAGVNGVTGNSDSVDLREDQVEQLLDSQILDLSDCLTEIEDLERTRNFS